MDVFKKAEIQWSSVFLRKLEKEQETVEDEDIRKISTEIKNRKSKHNSREDQQNQKFLKD